ncbi:Core-2/I-Branching enzyme [Variovorax sp. HW608]|nr:Core-2/I-Branching enzyme [Variovorax sp. HW608]
MFCNETNLSASAGGERTESMRIAVLILLHKWTDQQKRLVEFLAREYEVFIHADKRSKLTIETDLPRVHVYSEYKNYWGHHSVNDAAVFLFRQAAKLGFDRYLLISGDDVPIKPLSEITRFFATNDLEFFEHHLMPRDHWPGNGGFDRVDFFYPKVLSRGPSHPLTVKFTILLDRLNRRLLIPAMRKVARRPRMPVEYWGGGLWLNLSAHCVDQMLAWLDRNPWYPRKFHGTRCADEIFFQTLIFNFVPDVEVRNDHLRYIDWHSGPEFPRVMRGSDLEKMRQSPALFARKFDHNVDPAVIDAVYAGLG